MNQLTAQQAFECLQTLQGHQQNYFAMYSSIFDGIVTDPAAMVLPIDDHIVHRGDGVFEAIKFFDGRIYALDPHLQRLQSSMAAIEMPPPKTSEPIKNIVLATVRASKKSEGIIRVFVSRGPGGFTTNPYESIGSQLYVVITKIKLPTSEVLHRGVKLGISKFPVKPGFFATVKSCNYLPNVLMKKEALDAGLDYTISLDEKGFVAEGSTENVGCVTTEGDLVLPPFQRTLQGVTATRVLALADVLYRQGLIKSAQTRDLKVAELHTAREIHIYGTTIDVLPVGEFKGRNLTDFTVANKFRELLCADLQNPEISAQI